MKILSLALLLLLFSHSTLCDEETHDYKPGDNVHVWANKIGPYDNPQETYQYYTLPFCPPDDEVVHPPDGIGEMLEGNKLLKSRVHVKFGEEVESKTYCSMPLNGKRVAIFGDAIRESYWYQFIVDDLPMWAMLGAIFQKDNEEPMPYIYTHQRFDFAVNGGRFIEANLTSANPVPLVEGTTVSLTYSVHWHKSDQDYLSRYSRYLEYNFFEHQVHWFSIINSFMMVIFLVGLVTMILLRTLKNDLLMYASVSAEDLDLESDIAEESGWKLVAADVFRPPKHLELFSALLGTGAQLVLLVLFVLLFSLVSTWEVGRGRIFTATLFMYALTSASAGYVSGGFYARCNGRHWIKAMLLTASLFPGVVFAMVLSLDVVAMSYGSLAQIPIGTILSVMAIWALLSFPLTLAGTILGRSYAGKVEVPRRVNVIPRDIPERPWYLHPFTVCMLGGVLPFGSIFIEAFFVFQSFWLYKFYSVFKFLFLVFVILILVSLCVTVVTTYFLLNAEEYRWQWLSFFSSASTAVYVFLYAAYFYVAKTQMSGFFQTVFYFGYMSLCCLALGLLCGTVGFCGSAIFVQAIYSRVKSD